MTQQIVKDQMKALLHRVREKEAKESGIKLKQTKNEKRLVGKVIKKSDNKPVFTREKVNYMQQNLEFLKTSAQKSKTETNILDMLASRQPPPKKTKSFQGKKSKKTAETEYDLL